MCQRACTLVVVMRASPCRFEAVGYQLAPRPFRPDREAGKGRQHETKETDSRQATGGQGRAEEPRSKKRWGHPPEFRIRVVREVFGTGTWTRPEAARVFGVAVSTIADWMRRYRGGAWTDCGGERRGPPAGTKPARS